ncbi:flippase [Leptothoe sp. ISB3NOV94-8A]
MGAQSFTINGIWILVEKTVRLIVALISSIWLARYLQPSQYGALSYAIVFVSLFTNLTSLGLRDVVIREYINAKNSPDEEGLLTDVVLNTAIVLRCLAGILVIFFIVLYIFFGVNDQLTKQIILIISVGLIFKVSEVFEYPFEANIDTKSTNIAKAIVWTSKMAVLGILIYYKQPIYVLASLIPVEALISLIFLFFIYRNKKYRFQPLQLFSRQKAVDLLQDSWPLMISGLAVIIYMRADQVMLKSMVGNYEVGIYSAAAQLIEAIYVFPVAIINSILPKLIQAKSQEDTIFMAQQQRLYDATSLVSYGLISCTFILSRTLVIYIYGESYAKAGVILALLAWSILPVTLGVARNSFFITENCPGIKLQIVLVSCLLNVGLNFWLIPILSSIGAAIATLISYYFAVFVTCFLWRRLRPTGYMLLQGLWPVRLFDSSNP